MTSRGFTSWRWEARDERRLHFDQIAAMQGRWQPPPPKRAGGIKSKSRKKLLKRKPCRDSRSLRVNVV